MTGDLLAQKVDAIVNTVNTVGVMGKGVALQFKRKWPENFREYEKACKRGEVAVGKMFIYDAGGLLLPRYIINFPTKKHWRSPSKLEYIEQGLTDLVVQARLLNLRSLAMPPLGCGNGGLDWADVRPLIEQAFNELPDVEVRLFPPSSERRDLVSEAKMPPMTAGRAAVVSVLAMYQRLQYSLTQIEVQKLAYFLTEAGEDLTLKFVQHKYGPYSAELTHVLVKMEGAYISGLGDLDGPSEIRVRPEAVDLATAYLASAELETGARVTRISALIEGFETPFGMELLSTVHWAAGRIGPTANIQSVLHYIRGWNARKRNLMGEQLVERAFDRLRSEGWLQGG
jgi:O-acetyl-ADP-ribose deacetylase (regulator of RNase III)